MRLVIPQREIRRYSLSKIESPFFARFEIEHSLIEPSQVSGLINLIENCGSTVNNCLQWRDKERILDKVENGEWLLVKDKPFSPLSSDTTGVYSHLTNPSFGGFARQKTPEVNPTPQADLLTLPKAAEPGFYIVQSAMPRSALEALLFQQPNEASLDKFRALNPHLSDYAKPGQMAILSDPRNTQCTREEAMLMEAAAKVDAALEPMSDEEAAFFVKHREEIESFLSGGSGAIGIGEVMFSQHLDNVKETLVQIERLHQRTFQQHGGLQTAEFFAERQRLLGQLDRHLGPLVRRGIGFPDHPKLKSALGISSRSLIHHWSKAGAPGAIPGYATHIEGVSRAAKVIKLGGWVGVGLGASASAMQVQEACSAGREDECRKVALIEGGKFAGGIAGGAIAGILTGGATTGVVCGAIGLGTAGIGGIACGVVVVGGVSVIGGSIGEAGGEFMGNVVYESTK